MRARWALDLRKIPYEWVDHVPMIGEALLRIRARKLTGKVTVPLLVDAGTVLIGSFVIAEYADAHGEGPRLIPDELRGDIASWDELAEDAMMFARKLVVLRTAEDDSVLRASLPKALRNVPWALTSARRGTAFFRRKYALDAIDPSKEPLVRFLDRLRQTLAKSRFVVGTELTYADIIAATTLQCVRPAKRELWDIDDGLRPAWTDEELAARYGDLLDWRDAIFTAHR
ncbi:hypothetical protein BH09MYX1_BH09MYX1_63160 [soil metagenome]